jgi:hypothetical protein
MPHRSLVPGSNRGELAAMGGCLLLCALVLSATTASVIARGSPLQEQGRSAAALSASQQAAAASHSFQAEAVQHAPNVTSAAAAVLPLLRSAPSPDGALAAAYGLADAASAQV